MAAPGVGVAVDARATGDGLVIDVIDDRLSIGFGLCVGFTDDDQRVEDGPDRPPLRPRLSFQPRDERGSPSSASSIRPPVGLGMNTRSEWRAAKSTPASDPVAFTSTGRP